MAKIETYFNRIKALFTLSKVIKSYDIRKERIREKDGFIRIKATLLDNEIFEARA
jgi:hypothetical protein